MKENCVGIDRDNNTYDEIKKLQQQIIKEQKCEEVAIFKTKNGWHLLLIFNKKISKEKNFQLREKYGDCQERLRFSHLRSDGYQDIPHDILFTIKNGHWRERILD